MNCVIIEDEAEAVERLEQKLLQTGYPVNVVARIDSIEEAVPWLENNQADLIFLDIQLGDGLGFEIFDHVQIRTPVVFMTSYDQYMEKAFEVNSLAYLLKPVNLNRLKMSLDKYNFLVKSEDNLHEKVIHLNQQFQHRFLVKNGNTFQPIPVQDVAYFYIQNKTFLLVVTKNKQQYLYDSTLEVLEQRLNPDLFFRISRQCIIAVDIIKQVHYDDQSRRFMLETEPSFKEEMIVSRYRTTEFKAWLDK